MFKKIVSIISIIIIAVSASIAFLPTPNTFAVDPPASDICNKNEVPNSVKEAAGCAHEGDKLPSMVINILNAVIGILGLVAVIFIIIGGVNYMTSTGEAAKLEKAKKTILYAVIGLGVCVLAFAIVNFVANILNNS